MSSYAQLERKYFLKRREDPGYEELCRRLPATRAEALERGSKFFYTGEECANGHLSPRRSSSSRCLECETTHDAGRRFDAEWIRREREYDLARRTDPEFKEQMRQHFLAYRERNREQLNAKQRERYRRKKAEAAASNSAG